MNHSTKGLFCIAASTVLFSTMEIALKQIAGDFNPVQLNFIRFTLGGLFLLPFTISYLRRKGIRIKAIDLLFFLLTGFAGITVSMAFYQTALIETPASVVAVIFSCNPVFTAIFAALILKEKINIFTIFSAVLAAAGIILIAAPFNNSASPVQGIVLTICGATAFSLYGVLGRTKSSRLGVMAVTCFSFIAAGLEMLILIFISHLSPAISLLHKAGLEIFTSIPITSGISLTNLPVLLYVSIFVTGLGYTLYALAIRNTSAQAASSVFYIKPFLAALLSYFILNEVTGFTTAVGIALISAGSVFTLIKPKKPAKSPDTDGILVKKAS